MALQAVEFKASACSRATSLIFWSAPKNQLSLTDEAFLPRLQFAANRLELGVPDSQRQRIWNGPRGLFGNLLLKLKLSLDFPRLEGSELCSYRADPSHLVIGERQILL